MSPRSKLIFNCYWAATVALLLLAGGVLLKWTPTEATMGNIQKIFYIHLPMAINTFLCAMVVFIASIGYLLTRHLFWDDLACAAAKVAVLLCSGVLITGMIWGRGAWGMWWTWSPRLTFSLMLWLLYVVYLMVRTSVESPQRRAVISAVYGIVAFLDVPLVWLSARLMPDIHPASIQLMSQMKITLALWFVPVTLIAGGLIVGRYIINRMVRETQTQNQVRRGFGVVQKTARVNGGVA
jgi:heme exporter protein C